MSVVYFDQLLGAVRTQKLVEILFFQPFSTFFSDFTPEINLSKLVNMQKLVDSLRGYPKIVFFGLIFIK